MMMMSSGGGREKRLLSFARVRPSVAAIKWETMVMAIVARIVNSDGDGDGDGVAMKKGGWFSAAFRAKANGS